MRFIKDKVEAEQKPAAASKENSVDGRPLMLLRDGGDAGADHS
jgi:hypothetical protein